MFRLALACLTALALPAHAGPAGADFIDDRSSPERVVTSLYNAIDRQEYLRGWSYFADGAAPPYPEFRDGYAQTDTVTLRIGDVTSEGAAGSIHSAVPVALKAVDAGGTETVFTGCYYLTQVQPAVQDTPPFRPIQINRGTLSKATGAFDSVMGQCDP